MKLAALIIAMLFTLSYIQAADYRLIMAKNGKDIDIKTLAKDLANYDIIFFGEFHDNATIHTLQKEILPLLAPKRELILSFEMFERDVQDVLDSYLAGTLDETEFLENTRPWPNYSTDYRPLIEFAREHKLKAIAANVPRRLAGKMSRQGLSFLDELDPEELAWIAGNLTAPDDNYKKAFYATMNMGDQVAHGMMANTQGIFAMYQAQCMKDDTMAESIVQASVAHPNSRIVHFNGDFHSRSFLGTVSRVQAALPKLKIAVISPLYDSKWKQLKPDNETLSSGTHLILLPEPSEGDAQ
ncbi:MAG: ChaN family lipoprotein [Candidatus Cloacimonas sp.]|jgi:uncharacterized iron-regulated protein|nr:ChaN family lipoprotein [Candidatus Cloacimonas sp.]